MAVIRNVREGTPAALEIAARRRRQDYLYRLGIPVCREQARRPQQAAAQRPPRASPGQDKQAAPEAVADALPFDQGKCPEDPEIDDEQQKLVRESRSLSGGIDADVSVDKTSGQGNFRLNLLRKLSYAKVWVPQVLRPPKHQTVIIFDWDDTLLCTGFLTSLCKGQALSDATARSLASIERISKGLLEMAMRLGHTFIITNAATGWVEYSAAAYVPGILPVLRSVPVVSARTKYETQYPKDVGQWKTQAFLEVQRKLDSEAITNLISIGDSEFEMDAIHTMGKEFAEALTKTIKFTQNPSPEELVKQLDLVAKKFEKIVVRASNLQVGLERRAGQASPTATA